MKQKVKLIQELLNGAGYDAGPVDGIAGPQTIAAILEYAKLDSDWTVERLVTGCIQNICILNGFSPGPIDGYWGGRTQAAYEQLLSKLGIEEGKPSVKEYNGGSASDYAWPRQNYSSMVNFYGKVGENQTSLTLPYPMVIAWNTDQVIRKMTCHKKCAEAFEKIFKNTLDHYGLDAIKDLRLNYFGGCLNVRRVRGGSSWSIHSWGAAIDIDPARNQLKWGRDKAFLARSEYEPFWKIVEAEGGVSLGRLRNYDWMHFQMARL